ncbi:hypothetical protein [Bradyrhizobium iriomotense]|uniref:hypothetical protein n=1 Tax=Bradyrhizobium iriomotense TaxID=441950 RepID=UPI001B8A12B8|nr:hypothetical protein [Bradyrhizobium iriomotense]MBR0784644.1 hypothetical protein [Bradyrhizobium iriomotense]
MPPDTIPHTACASRAAGDRPGVVEESIRSGKQDARSACATCAREPYIGLIGPCASGDPNICSARAASNTTASGNHRAQIDERDSGAGKDSAASPSPSFPTVTSSCNFQVCAGDPSGRCGCRPISAVSAGATDAACSGGRIGHGDIGPRHLEGGTTTAAVTTIAANCDRSRLSSGTGGHRISASVAAGPAGASRTADAVDVQGKRPGLQISDAAIAAITTAATTGARNVNVPRATRRGLHNRCGAIATRSAGSAGAQARAATTTTATSRPAIGDPSRDGAAAKKSAYRNASVSAVAADDAATKPTATSTAASDAVAASSPVCRADRSTRAPCTRPQTAARASVSASTRATTSSTAIMGDGGFKIDRPVTSRSTRITDTPRAACNRPGRTAGSTVGVCRRREATCQHQAKSRAG